MVRLQYFALTALSLIDAQSLTTEVDIVRLLLEHAGQDGSDADQLPENAKTVITNFLEKSDDRHQKNGVPAGTCPQPEDAEGPCEWPQLPLPSEDGINRSVESSSEFTVATTDCDGNSISGTKTWYSPVNAVAGKSQVMYHAADSIMSYADALTYCRTGTPAGSHLFCPGSDDENTLLFDNHPMQPFGPIVTIFPGSWTGITGEGTAGNWVCDEGRYAQTFFSWWGGWPKGSTTNIIQAHAAANWLNFNPTDHRGTHLLHVWCELNCDVVTVCESLNCAQNVDASSICTDNGDGTGSCSCDHAAGTAWDGSSCVSTGPTTELYTQTGLYLRSYASQVLSEFLSDDTNMVDEILSHGCFCAKLDLTNPHLDHLGGTDVLDEVDEICRDWLRARNCNDNLFGGSCAADRESMRTGAYTMSIVTPTVDSSNCGFTTTDCEADTCKIDLVHLKLIRNFVDDNPSFTASIVTGPGSCAPAPLDKRERKCLGEAPDVYPKRMSNLEQLLSRIDYNEGDLDDAVSYFGGGLKLDDKKEYISLEVFNQLVTFGWQNVKSFTVETVDAFHPYHVGWVEKPQINNFAPGGTDTLGDETKGGIRTVGIFSGDAKMKVGAGFQMSPSHNADFWDSGDSVTCVKENGEFSFYVNGNHVGTFSYDWADAYPALDLTTRDQVKITSIEYEE